MLESGQTSGVHPVDDVGGRNSRTALFSLSFLRPGPIMLQILFFCRYAFSLSSCEQNYLKQNLKKKKNIYFIDSDARYCIANVFFFENLIFTVVGS